MSQIYRGELHDENVFAFFRFNKLKLSISLRYQLKIFLYYST